MQFEIDLHSRHAETFTKAREILLAITGVTEQRKPRITTYSFNSSALCHLRTMKNGIDFGFLKGAKFDDKLQRLTGSGKLLRVLSLADLEPTNRQILDYYLAQALEFNR